MFPQTLHLKKKASTFVKNEKYLVGSFVLFCILNIVLYLNVLLFHSLVPFSTFYTYVHRYSFDARASGGTFDFLRSLNQTDAQWYTHIAEVGYVKHPTFIGLDNLHSFSGLSWNFYPVYPTCVWLLNHLFHNIELTAFVLSCLLLVANFLSLYKLIISLGQNAQIAAKTCLLFFFYPFSVYFRSYYSESLFLFIIIWFYYYFSKRKYLIASFLLSLLVVTRGTAMLFIPFFLFNVLKEVKSIRRTLLYAIVSGIFLGVWMLDNYLQTGNALYFLSIRTIWIPPNIPFRNAVILNIAIFGSFFTLPMFFRPYNQVDVLIIIFFGFLLIKSRKAIEQKLWIPGFLLWLTPLLFNSTMSFNRYVSVIFQPYIYIVKKLPFPLYCLALTLSYLCLNGIMLMFINAYWIG